MSANAWWLVILVVGTLSCACCLITSLETQENNHNLRDIQFEGFVRSSWLQPLLKIVIYFTILTGHTTWVCDWFYRKRFKDQPATYCNNRESNLRYSGTRLGFQNVAVGHIDRVATLARFSYKKMYECFDGTKKSGCNNKVTVWTRWP